MNPLDARTVLVLGLDPSGDAVAAWLRARGASVQCLPATTPANRLPADLTGGAWPELVVASAGCPARPPAARAAAEAGVPVVGERELAFQGCLCLHVAVTGASGKSTTAALVAHILRSAGRRVEIADAWVRPASSLVDVSRELDFLIHVVEPAELEHFHSFRPVVGVLLNAPSDHPGTEESWDEYVARLARLFAGQQAFDWAIVQSEALAHLVSVGIELPGKTITFSSTSRQADLHEDRGLLTSRLEGWSGPLWDMARGRMKGPHFAEDLLAALAVGRVLRISLEQTLAAVASFEPGPSRLEMLGEVEGVRFVDDGCARNLDALARALLTLAPTPPDRAFIWLLAGGDSGGRQFYDLGPLLSPRVRQAYVFGEAAGGMRAAWSLFVPCSPMASLLDAARSAAAQAEPGDVVLFSPACPSRDPSGRPLVASAPFREAAMARLKTTGPAAAGA